MINILFCLVAYLLGGVPFGLLLGRAVGVDVRNSGSGNIGATNVNRLLGRRLGLLTLGCDVLKGYLPVLAAFLWLPESSSREFFVALCGLAAVVGHMFPVYLRFQGGKGVATAVGVFLFFAPLAVLISLFIFAASVGLSGFVSVGSLLASGLIPLWICLVAEPSPAMLLLALAVVALIWFQHRANIVRLLRGEEKSWRKKESQA
ncbi:MAG: glycerol-3-phosphate 1-O-acyltransferase PlsY [Desulfobulbaceae bacterium]|uniref:Glycerol-3-phosphate acyltransferase n=1 Tax=Candidatus Desulfatifera sulfidica TaxID=2841691 RepID=A0A8J6N8X4_9BACT|nr:glycerol-3-phosphate 1-O-acyltransferase PlsY [Candidatus Desulfatifera sulfidica]